MPREERDWETGMERDVFRDPESPEAMAERRLPYGLRELPKPDNFIRLSLATQIYCSLITANGGAKKEHIDQAVELTDLLIKAIYL